MVRALELIHTKDNANECEEVSILQVLVIGNHSSGKSTFINKLLGKEAVVRLLSSGVQQLQFLSRGPGYWCCTHRRRLYHP